MRKRSIFAVIAAFALVLAACGTSETEDEATTTTAAVEEETSVLDLAVEAGQFSTLVAAVEAADLVETLEGEGPFTVFAPTDAAFEAAFETLGITAEELLADTETLTAILTYHVIAGQAADSQLVSTLDGQSIETVNGQSVQISVQDGQIMIDEATVVSADLEADNGIVHVINAVLLPPDIAEALGVAGGEDTTTTTVADETTTTESMSEPTIADIVIEMASADPAEFTILLAAVKAADPAVLETLSDPEAELTVFAPTDAAFEAAFEALGIAPEDLLADTEGLTDILLYHVLGQVVTSADIAAAGAEEIPVETALGAELIVTVGDDGTVGFVDQDATVVQADVAASNGVIHVIDGVLLPPSDS